MGKRIKEITLSDPAQETDQIYANRNGADVALSAQAVANLAAGIGGGTVVTDVTYVGNVEYTKPSLPDSEGNFWDTTFTWTTTDINGHNHNGYFWNSSKYPYFELWGRSANVGDYASANLQLYTLNQDGYGSYLGLTYGRGTTDATWDNVNHKYVDTYMEKCNADDALGQIGFFGITRKLDNSVSYNLSAGITSYISQVSAGAMWWLPSHLDFFTQGTTKQGVIHRLRIHDDGGVTLLTNAGLGAAVEDWGNEPLGGSKGEGTLNANNLYVKGVGLSGATTVAALPAASSVPYTRTFVTDATATTFNSVVAGGGTVTIPVYSDGTNWRIG